MVAPIETVTLGRSDLLVSRVGFGCWQLGGHGWQDINQQAIVAAIHASLDAGVNFFDTADIYGIGASETLLGKTLKGKRAVISSKFGVRQNQAGATYYDNSQAWMTEALEGSLRRLQRDVIDLYQLHWHDGVRPLADIFSDLEALRQAGKIRWYGISNIDPGMLPAALPPGLVSFTLEYNLLQRKWENAVTQAQKHLGFIAWGALAQGLLTGAYTRLHRFAPEDIRSRPDSLFAEKNWDRYEPLLAVLKDAAAAHGHSMAQTSLRWLLDAQPQGVLLAGIKNPAQLWDNIGACGWYLEPRWLAALEQVSRML